TAKWLNPVRAWSQNLDQRAACAIDLRDNRFMGQGIGDEDQATGALRDPFAALPKPLDGEARVETDHPLIAPRRNSWLPSPPSIGEGRIPMTCQPRLLTRFSIFSQASRLIALSLTMPLTARPGPASNCGLTSAISDAPGAASGSTAGST